MSDTEPMTPGKGAATGAAWTDAERGTVRICETGRLLTIAQMAYLSVVAEHALDAPIESKVSQAPVPGGRNVNACRKIIKKLEEKLKDGIENIKAGLPVAPPAAEGDTATATPSKGTPRKRKIESGAGGKSPKKKATPRQKKSEAIVKDEEEADEAA